MQGYVGKNSIGTGDINLAAALMAVSIPLDDREPAALILSDNGQTYGRFYLYPSSEDGQRNTESLMSFWSGNDDLPNSDPFRQICEFIKARPSDVRHEEDWLGFCIDYLAQRGIAVPGLTRIDQIADYVKALPESLQAYLLAFVANRSLCIDLYKTCKRKIMMSKRLGWNQTAHSLIDTRLDKSIRNNLLSRLEG